MSSWRFIALEYAARLQSFSAFQTLFYAHTWQCEQGEIYSIKLLLAEFSHGDWTEEELQSQIRSIASTYAIGVALPVYYGTSSTTIFH